MGEKKDLGWKFVLLALAIGFVSGFFSLVYLSTTGNAVIPTLPVGACYKYTGSLPEAYCDTAGNLHFYFEGSSDLQEGWYVVENHPDCVPCPHFQKITVE